ncbi:MAG: DnaJ domain-containing protein, partial [bacterium]|nr:DnaJ domain-containing protein [bacterium]
AAEEKFKKINEAYAVLSDDQKRKQYDMFGAEGFSKRYSRDDIFRGFDVGSIFQEFGMGSKFGGGGGGDFFSFFGGGGGPRGGRGRQNSRDPFGGASGFGGNPGHGHGHSRPQTAETELKVTLEDVVFGSKKRVTIDTGSGIENIDLSIPIGIEDGQKMRLKGKGPANPMTGGRGDLFCKITIAPHNIFLRKGRDLVMDKEVNLTDMVLGGKVRIDTIDNGSIDIKVPPHSKNGSKMRIKGKGIPAAGNKAAGNLLVSLQVRLPSALDENQKKLFKELAETGI